MEEESTNNVTEEVIYNKIFIAKISNQSHDKETFIVDSNSTSHMVNSEENMTNFKDAKT